ncbi:Alpha-L-rhamnosidase [Arthrobacter sp. 9V]|uniref:glycosyl hydrolase n=1 Tax=Arthrobacter sp. 9V TaxID=2653132 RepID=UPI0012EEF064|nr:glycosyl hydrolase [Arthrobacter sp. 9V]VXC33091.1 Alpha-L-rhamnosidase [Arthrobacter sp. 9V]
MNGKTSDILWSEFVDPPDSARPRAWWHWMDGNVDLDGVRADLRWLHSVGVRGVQSFDGALGNPLVVEKAVIPGSEQWREAVGVAVATAHDLGLDFTVATSAGWSASGAPWVDKADAMRKLVWSQTVVQGGELTQLNKLPDVAGPYQDIPRWGAAPQEGSGDAKDLFALAIPFHSSHDALEPGFVRTSDSPTEAVTANQATAVDGFRLTRDPDNPSVAWIEQSFTTPVTVRSCVIELPGPHGFGAAPPATASLQVQDDDGGYVTVCTLPATQCPSRSMSFPAVTGTHFRLRLEAEGISTVLAAFEKGVVPPPVFRPLNEYAVKGFALYESGIPAHREAKSGFATALDYDSLDTDPAAAFAAVPLASILDVSSQISQGGLTSPLPEGKWRVVRFGSSLTGQTNGPALPEATGLEVDKLDSERVRRYITTHLAQFDDAPIDGLLSDSIEAGLQNITDHLGAGFLRLRGYNMIPWMLTTAGFLVEDAHSSDLFLADFRRTLTEVFAESYYGTLSAEAHQRGAIYYAEALEDRRPQLGDDLAMRSHADVPMGAMWTFSSKAGPAPTYVADLKGASSVAHVYGRSHTGSEAFTSGRNPWSDSPKSLKHVADLQLALGVTRFCIHTSPHQPTQVPPPGIALAPSLGQSFTRNETWASSAKPWVDYLARCSHLLSLGRPAVDIAYFIGEEAPVTALFGNVCNRDVPADYDYDYLGPDALKTVLHVQEGELQAGSSRYRLLYLGGASNRMSTGALQAILRLVEQGATVVGERPTAKRSLADEDTEYQRLCGLIWGSPNNHSPNKGRIFPTADLASVLREHFPPSVSIGDPRVRRIARWVDGDQPLLFIANPVNEELRTTVRLPETADDFVAWDPVTLSQRALSRSDGGDGLDVRLPPYGSLFILRGEADPVPVKEQVAEVSGQWTLTIPGSDPVQLPHATFWTDPGIGAEHFSGTATYVVEFQLHGPELPHAVQFADVADVAQITINGEESGILWTAPYRVHTNALRPGTNRIRISVTNPWRNRLIAEARSNTGTLFPPMTSVFNHEADIQPAGLRGPLSLVYKNRP